MSIVARRATPRFFEALMFDPPLIGGPRQRHRAVFPPFLEREGIMIVLWQSAEQAQRPLRESGASFPAPPVSIAGTSAGDQQQSAGLGSRRPRLTV